MRFTSSLAFTLTALSVALPTDSANHPNSTLPNITTAINASCLSTAPSLDSAEPMKQIDEVAQFAAQQADARMKDAATEKRRVCSPKHLSIRREWGSLSNSERKAYTNAVLCLQAKTAKTPSSQVPGAKSRFDDWVATHINQTLTIHYTGTFLAWHRYFIWQYEQALRNECGYTGYQPYWSWPKTAESGLEASPIFDGSDYSMSGNGEFIPDRGNVILGGGGLPELHIPPGTGGGCVKSGPFKNMTVDLGPVALPLTNGSTVGNGDGLSYNPRCLKRDLTDFVNKKWANAQAFMSLLLTHKDIESFQMAMQGVPGSGNLGVHGGGHFSLGGDPGRDFYISPGDPAFYLHHAAIDRAWWLWQSLDRETRTGAQGISGTGTFLNQPPSANTTLDTTINLGYAAGPPVRMADIMDTLEGPFCYIYL